MINYSVFTIQTKRQNGVTTEKAVIFNGEAWTESRIRFMVGHYEKSMLNALVKIYNCQTDDEKLIGITNEFNDIGFSGADGEILTSFAKFYLKNGYLSPKQKKIAFKKMQKYSKQLFNMMVAATNSNVVKIKK